MAFASKRNVWSVKFCPVTVLAAKTGYSVHVRVTQRLFNATMKSNLNIELPISNMIEACIWFRISLSYQMFNLPWTNHKGKICDFCFNQIVIIFFEAFGNIWQNREKFLSIPLSLFVKQLDRVALLFFPFFFSSALHMTSTRCYRARLTCFARESRGR